MSEITQPGSVTHSSRNFFESVGNFLGIGANRTTTASPSTTAFSLTYAVPSFIRPQIENIRLFAEPFMSNVRNLRVPLAGNRGVAEVEVHDLAPVSNVNEQPALRVAANSTVFIRAQKDGQQWSGSGVIIDPRDLKINLQHYPAGTQFILTNNHVAGDTDFITTTLPGNEEIEAELVKTSRGSPLRDKIADFALVAIRPSHPFPMARLGDVKTVNAGDRVIAAGHPHSLPNLVVTSGTVTQTQQETGEAVPGLQTDAAINGGNSGGPLLNEKGEVIGLNTYKFNGADNTAFAMPINAQLEVMERIERYGRPIRGDVGIVVGGFPLLLRKQLGFTRANGFPDDTAALVSFVDKGSAAERAGLKPGDILTSMKIKDANGTVIRDIDLNMSSDFESGVFARTIQAIAPGSRVEFTSFRAQKNGDKIVFGPAKQVTVPVAELTDKIIEERERALQSEDGAVPEEETTEPLWIS